MTASPRHRADSNAIKASVVVRKALLGYARSFRLASFSFLNFRLFVDVVTGAGTVAAAAQRDAGSGADVGHGTTAGAAYLAPLSRVRRAGEGISLRREYLRSVQGMYCKYVYWLIAILFKDNTCIC